MICLQIKLGIDCGIEAGADHFSRPAPACAPSGNEYCGSLAQTTIPALALLADDMVSQKFTSEPYRRDTSRFTLL
jgi:hypothetical protein